MSTQRKVSNTKLDSGIWEKLRLEEGWFSFFMLLLAFMIVVWSIQGANWVDGSYLLPRAALVSFLIGFGLSKVRFVPSPLAHSFMLSVGMVFVGLLVGPYAGDDRGLSWSQRLGSTVLRVVRWCETAIAGNSHDDGLVYLAMLAFGIWVLGYSAAWVLFRGHKVWWALAMLGTVLMVNLANNPPNAFTSFTLFLIVSLLLVVRFNAYMDEQRWRNLRFYFPPGLWRGALAVGSCLVLVVVAVAFATPSSSQIDQFGQVLNTVSQPFNGVKGVWDQFGTGGSDGKDALLQRAAGNYNTLDDSFTIGGPLRLSNAPFFKVTGLDPRTPPAYMQVVALDEYDGKGWLNTYQSPPGTTRTSDVLFRRLSLAANQSLPTSTDQGRTTNKLTVTPLVPYSRPLSLGELVSTDHSSLVAFHYEKVTINAPLEAIQLRDVPDGNGGKRSVLVDTGSGQLIPPALLDLVKDLKDGSQLTDLAYPATLTANYSVVNGTGRVQVSGDGKTNTGRGPANGRNVLDLRAGLPTTFNQGDWTYQLPALEQLQALALQPGSAPAVNKLGALTATNTKTQKTAALNTTVYLNSDGTWILNLESPFAVANQAQSRFEATSAGQQVLAEEQKITEAVKGNKVSYDLTNGLPTTLHYDGYEPNYDDLTTSLFQQVPAVGDTYNTYGRRYTADVETLRRAATTYPAWVKERYLQLPTDLPPIFKSQADDLIAGIPNTYDKVMAMVSYLNSLNYTTDPPPVPAGRSELEYFLSESKSGYCVHFAGSLALMLRTEGIPSRIVNGFIGGEYDTSSNAWIVKGSAAHSWVQVYFPGAGWVDFEPTPGRQGISRPADPSQVPPAPLVTPPADNSADTSGTNILDPTRLGRGLQPKDDADNSAGGGAAAGSKNEPPWLLFGLVALVVAGVGGFQLRRIYLQRLFALPDPSPLVVYNRMSRQAQRAGLKGRVGMTPNEYAGYLTSRLPSATDSVDAITRAYVRRRYGPEGEDLYEEQRRQRLAAAQQAETKLRETDKTGHDARPEDLWQAFRAHTEVYKDDRQIGQVWEAYQQAVLDYRRQQRYNRLVPAAFRSLSARFRRKSTHR